MMSIWAYTLISVFIVSLISFIGVFTLGRKKNQIAGMLHFLVSFAVGGLFGDAIIHLLPEAYESFANPLTVSLYVLLGILIFFSLEKFIRWRHCHHSPDSQEHHHPVATLNLIGDGVHNFIDGLLIAVSYAVSIPLGLSTTLAVVLHEIPQEIGDFGILTHSGFDFKKVLGFNFLSAVFAIVGAIISLAIGPSLQGYTQAFIPITAGGFIYIAGSDLIPELHHDTDAKRSLSQLFAILLGIAIMVALTALE